MTLTDHFWRYVDRTAGCWLWTGGTDRRGYGIYHDPTLAVRSVRAHRYVYERTHGAIPRGLFVLHHCDMPGCVRPKHLYLGTHAQNMADMVARNRQARGERHGSVLHPERVASGSRNGHVTHPERTPNGEAVHLSKLTVAKVMEIRRRCAAGDMSQRQIARSMGISLGAVGSIVRGRTWKHVQNAVELEALS